MRPCRSAIVAAILVLAAGGCGSSQDDARTYYESLDLATPSAAVTTFADAFGRDDFMTVWLAFDGQAQNMLMQHINLLEYGEVIGPEGVVEFRNWLENEFSIDQLEVIDQWYFFDRMMLIADTANSFLIDLSGEVSIDTATPSGDTAVVLAEVEGIPGVVEFRLSRSLTDRWKISQVVVPGGDEARIPWSLSSSAE